MVTGPEPGVLYTIGQDIERRLSGAGGLKSVSLSWTADKKEVNFIADREKCALYGISPREIAAQVQRAAFDYLDAPIVRVGAPFAPIPFSAPLEDAYLPGADDVVAAVQGLLQRG